MLARSGAAVALVARDTNALEDMQEQIWDQGGHAITAPADCTVPEQLREAAVSVAERLGPVSVLAAFAGGGGRPEPSLSMPLDTWNRVIAGDLTSTFATIQAFAPTMLQRGYGSIITMSSAAGRSPSQSNVAYAVAKAGVVMLTKHLAAEWAPAGVRVNCIAPSAVHNEKMDLAMGPEQLAEFGRSFPLGRVGEPVDVATATAFLASDAAGWITGVTLDMSGGRVIV
jgi:3-oxoacyl-[acyl-carrier protein] reductase